VSIISVRSNSQHMLATTEQQRIKKYIFPTLTWS